MVLTEATDDSGPDMQDLGFAEALHRCALRVQSLVTLLESMHDRGPLSSLGASGPEHSRVR
jgi:hypothetical protein